LKNDLDLTQQNSQAKAYTNSEKPKVVWNPKYWKW